MLLSASRRRQIEDAILSQLRACELNMRQVAVVEPHHARSGAKMLQRTVSPRLNVYVAGTPAKRCRSHTHQEDTPTAPPAPTPRCGVSVRRWERATISYMLLAQVARWYRQERAVGHMLARRHRRVAEGGYKGEGARPKLSSLAERRPKTECLSRQKVKRQQQ